MLNKFVDVKMNLLILILGNFNDLASSKVNLNFCRTLSL